MNTQLCSKCDKELAVDCFSWKNKKKGRRHSYCKECMKAYARKHYRKNPQEYKNRVKATRARNTNHIREILLSSYCIDCGISDIRVLEFDHMGNDKEESISKAMRSWSTKRLDEEIAKCEVRCRNCHSIRHAPGTWRDMGP